MTLFVVFFLPLVAALGTWQLDRAAQKRAMAERYLEQLSRLPVAPERRTALDPFTRVVLSGQFTQEVFLVDNQIEKGQVGYWVVHTFDDESGDRFLVNRGFVAAPVSRQELPVVDAPDVSGTVGVVWPYTGLVPVLDDDVWDDGWPKRVQRMDIERMARRVGARELEIRLEPGQAGVYKAAPFAARMTEGMHLGYATTWFGLGLALLVLYVWFGFKQGAIVSER